MFCPKCGAAQSDDAAFCPGCGAALRAVPVTPAAASPAKPKRSRRGILTGLAAVAILGIGALILWKGPGNSKAISEAVGESSASVPSVKGLGVLLNGLQAGSAPLPDMKQVADNDGALEFTRPNDRREVFGVPVESIRYTYYGGKALWTVSYMVTAQNAEPLLAAMKREYGDPEWTDTDGFHHWNEPKGERKNFSLAAGYFVEETGEAGIYVMSGPVGQRVAAFALKKATEEVEAEEAGATESPSSAETQASEERAGRDAVDPDKVFAATFSCAAPPDRSIAVAQCFTESSIKIRRGNRAAVYSMYQIHQAARGNDTVTIDLPASFEIEAMNSAPFDGIHLTLSITEKDTGKVVFEDQAARWGWIKVKN